MEEKREEEIEELKLMLDMLLLFFTKREAEIFKLREVDMLSWGTIAGITGMKEVACRVIFHRMQDRVKVVRERAGKMKKYLKNLKEFEVWENLTSEQKEKVMALSAKDVLEEERRGMDKRRRENK